MRQAYAHDALLVMDTDADERAPGAAVTVALCGSWDHAPPCPLAPHHVHADRVGGEVRLRVLFAADPADEQRVRRLIDQALAGDAALPVDLPVTWRLIGRQPGEVTAAERDHADRLTRS